MTEPVAVMLTIEDAERIAFLAEVGAEAMQMGSDSRTSAIQRVRALQAEIATAKARAER